MTAVGQTTDRKETQQLARKAFVAEKDEDQHRAVLNAAANGDAKAANKKIVDNTPIVLDGLQSIMSNPSMANTMKSLNKIETARYVIIHHASVPFFFSHREKKSGMKHSFFFFFLLWLTKRRRNAQILPSITQLSNSAFQNTGVDQEAKKFQATTGTKMLKQLAAKNN